MDRGESPHQCARREIQEEAGIDVPTERLRLLGLVSERAFEGTGHWLMFYFRVLGPVEVPERDISEGRLRWFERSRVAGLPLPETDRRVIWPLVDRHTLADHGEAAADAASLPGLFSVHIDCSGPAMRWEVEQVGRADADGGDAPAADARSSDARPADSQDAGRAASGEGD